jgi:hypothetical protein
MTSLTIPNGCKHVLLKVKLPTDPGVMVFLYHAQASIPISP